MNENTLTIHVVLILILKLCYLGVGYLTVKMGYNLLRDGIKGEFKFTAELTGWKATLSSLSPGLFFILLGIVLGIYSINVDKGIEIEQLKAQEHSSAPHIDVPVSDSLNIK